MSLRGFESLDLGDNPLDLVEEVVAVNEWQFERASEEELSVCVAGSWCDYHLGFSYLGSRGGLQIACAYDVRVPERKWGEICNLLALVNERMWLGHFDLWSEQAIPMFRHGVLLRGGHRPTSEQIGETIEIAISECERYYPAFQFVLWGGKSADEAIAAAMLETAGEA
jgi:hypothetical protein